MYVNTSTYTLTIIVMWPLYTTSTYFPRLLFELVVARLLKKNDGDGGGTGNFVGAAGGGNKKTGLAHPN